MIQKKSAEKAMPCISMLMKIVLLKLAPPVANIVLVTATVILKQKNISATSMGRYLVDLSAARASPVSNILSRS